MGLNEKKRLRQQREQSLRRLLKYGGIFVLFSASVVGILFLVVRLAAATKEDFLAEADELVQQNQYSEAIIQYRRAIQLDGNYGQARYQLAEAYLHQGQLRGAMAEYIRAGDLLPDNVDAQLKAIRFLLVARRFEDAKTRAEGVLAQDPKNVEAQIAKATAVAKMVDLNGGLFEIQQAIRMDPQDARSFMMLGAIKGGQRNLPEAEAAFKRAVELAPKSVTALQALAVFYWKTARLDEAEMWLRRAADADPTQLDSQRKLAAFLVFVGRGAEAEAPLKALADKTQTTAAMLMLADYYIGQGRSADARARLEPLTHGDVEAVVGSRTRLARLDFSEGKRNEAYANLTEALAKDSKDVDALVLRSQFFIVERDTARALQIAREAVSAGPASTEARVVLAEAFARRHELAESIRSLNEVLQMNPTLESAKIRLIQLHILKGDAPLAVRLAEEAVRANPESVAALMVRAKAKIAANDLSGAERDLTVLVENLPDFALVHSTFGELHARRNNLAAARRSFDQAAKLDPGSFEALRGYVALDVVEKKPERAVAVLEQRLKSAKDDPSLLMLSASVYAVTGDLAKRESVLRRIIEIDDNALDAIAALANQYVDQNRLDEAKVKFESLTRGPANVGAQTMVGLILQTQNKKAEAKAIYERLVAEVPNAVVAANNLAWLYAESDSSLDRALELAQSATRQQPNSAEFNHTLGVIYMKRGLTPSAVRAFQTAVKSAPNEPEYHYQLGLAYTKNGDRRPALEELNAALKLKPDFRLAQLALEVLSAPSLR
jgi:tetratricopeptide (TPR) repeat protein